MQELWDSREIVLLRWSQLGALLCGLLLIMIGVGIQAPWLRACLQLALTGTMAGLFYEHRLRQRGESDGFAALLPVASGVSSLLALVVAA
ncbi:MAG TPA: hypothetical protein VFM32_06840 [Spongiibacteraceae bacterium]|nr:hypothetical protein [Spongiibacteraceae bacterium]